MVKKIVDTKLRTLIKAYLVFHKGKKCTAKEIAEWVNTNDFKLNQYNLHPTRVSSLVNSGKWNTSHILYGVNVEKVGGVNRFWVEP